MNAVAMMTPEPKYFANLDGGKMVRKSMSRGEGWKECLLENAFGNRDKTGAMCNDGEVCTERTATPNDEDRCDTETSVGSGTTARTTVDGRV